jgi:glycosyltransferase involved in cell wall biosynthesis
VQLSVVVTSFNDGPLIREAIAPVLADPATGEVIVVFDGSSDGSFESVQEQARHDERIRPFLIENRGRPGACQFGIEQARCDVVLLIDSDVIAADSLVTGHARWHQDGAPRIVVGYMPIRQTPRRPGSFIKEHYSRLYELRSAEFERNPGTILTDLWAGNMSLPRASLMAAGGFDAGLGLRYSDDLELGLRLAATGLEPVFDRRLLAEHRFERSVAGFLGTARKYGEDMVRIAARHPGRVRLPPAPRSSLDAALRRLIMRPRPHRRLVGAGLVVMRWAGRLGLYGVERAVGLKLERVEIGYGMHPAVDAAGGHSVAGSQGPRQPPTPLTSRSASAGPQDPWAYGIDFGGESSSG